MIIKTNIILKHRDKTFTFRYVLNKLVGFHYYDHVVSKEYLYQRNIQGDILGIYDDEGNQVGEYAYDGYGNPVIVKNEGGYISLYGKIFIDYINVFSNGDYQWAVGIFNQKRLKR